MKIQRIVETEYDEYSDPAPIRRERRLLVEAVAMLNGFDEEAPKGESNVGFRNS